MLGHIVTICTALSISEIATNQKVEGGGEYFIISRSFGINIGAAIGIAITGMVVLLVRFITPEFPVQLQASTFLIAAAVAIATGLLSGIWPAWKSSQLSPIEALRSE